MYEFDQGPSVITMSMGRFLMSGCPVSGEQMWDVGDPHGEPDEMRQRLIARVANHIAQRSADVIGLSEVWDLELAFGIVEAVRGDYPHSSLIRFDVGERISEMAEQTFDSESIGSFAGAIASLGVAAHGLFKGALGRDDGPARGTPRLLRSGLLMISRAPLEFAHRPRFFPAGQWQEDDSTATPGVLLGEIDLAHGKVGLFLTHGIGKGCAEQREDVCGLWAARDELLADLVDSFRREHPGAAVTVMRDDVDDEVAKVARSRSPRGRTRHLTELSAEAWACVSQVADDPMRRYELRERWYQKWGSSVLGDEGYGRSELDFLMWEIQRGVLNPLEHRFNPGSRWWRGMQQQYAFFAHLAGMIRDTGLSSNGLPNCIVAWLQYFERPTPESWYRAHNVNIIRGYLDWAETAQSESYPEQLLLNKVLYRVLFAQALIEGQTFGLLGEMVADPRMLAVDFIVELDALYPQEYPLTYRHMDALAYRGRGLDDQFARLLDCDLILPHLLPMYAWAAEHNREPALKRLVNNGSPVYPYHDWYAERVVC